MIEIANEFNKFYNMSKQRDINEGGDKKVKMRRKMEKEVI